MFLFFFSFFFFFAYCVCFYELGNTAISPSLEGVDLCVNNCWVDGNRPALTGKLDQAYVVGVLECTTLGVHQVGRLELEGTWAAIFQVRLHWGAFGRTAGTRAGIVHGVSKVSSTGVALARWLKLVLAMSPGALRQPLQTAWSIWTVLPLAVLKVEGKWYSLVPLILQTLPAVLRLFGRHSWVNKWISFMYSLGAFYLLSPHCAQGQASLRGVISDISSIKGLLLKVTVLWEESLLLPCLCLSYSSQCGSSIICCAEDVQLALVLL